MRGVLLIPSSSPTLSPIYDSLDVSVTSNITRFHLNDDMVTRRIYKLFSYGRHSITKTNTAETKNELPTIWGQGNTVPLSKTFQPKGGTFSS